MRRLPLALLAAVFSASLASAASAAEAPPFPGVYGCFGTYYAMGVQFGLVNATTYSTFDGGRGHYSYDAKTEILTMTDGPHKGLRYHRIEPTGWSFSVVHDHGPAPAQTCPYNPAKDPTKPHW